VSNSSQIIKNYINEISATLAKLPVDSIEQVVQVLEAARTQKKRVFLFGNGGSAATASHFACDLAKGAIAHGKPRLRAISLTDNIPLHPATGRPS
jgi:D-sedoheptulose 7-phosphate isomerase